MKNLFNSLSIKLVIAIGAFILLGGALFWYMIVIKGEEKFFDYSIDYTATLAEIIEKSIYVNMLRAQTEIIQQSTEFIGKSENILNINIYDHSDGTIYFASKQERRGEKISNLSSSCILCHKDTTLPQKPKGIYDTKGSTWKVFSNGGGRILRLARPIINQSSCYTAPCHHHDVEKKIIAIMETDYSLSSIDETVQKQKRFTLFWGFVFTLFVGVFFYVILWKIIIKPLQVIAEGMNKVSMGDFEHRIEITTKDEIGMLARTFNEMTEELEKARERLQNWAEELEEEVNKKTAEIKRGQERFLQAEKLASLGRMAAGVAHELNSPLTGIVTFAHLMLKRTPLENKMDREDINVIIEQAERCSKIIKGLLGFSRTLPPDISKVDINSNIKSTLAIIQNQAKFHNIKINTDLSPDLPPIEGAASQLQQVYMNLLINAADAMNDKGEIRIATRKITDDGKDFIEIEVTDTGPGIHEGYLDRLFEPFFTTKPVGKGTGLGLAVSHGIVKKYGGNIRVESTPNKGTSFFIRLPRVEENSERGG